MFLRVECPNCKSVLQVEEALAGKQGKCIHCGQKIIVPSQSGLAALAPSAPPPPVPFLTEATPEAMIRELHERKKTAVLLIFEPSPTGSYDLADVADAKIKCIATEDVNKPRFEQIIGSFANRFLSRKPAAKSPTAAGPQPTASESFVAGRLSGTFENPELPYEIKGDALGSSITDFKQKYARFSNDGRQDLPICSDMPGYIGKADLHGEAWHRKANIVHARIDHPLEDSSPTIAGVKTDLFLYHFVDGKLYRISAWFATDLFHLVSEAVIQKFGKPSRETKQPRELLWENRISQIVLTRGTVHPRTSSSIHLIHKELLQLVEQRTPKASEDI